MTQRPRLRRREAAEYLGEKHGLPIKPATLAKYATVGGGPVFRLFGRFPVYDVEALDEWAEAKLSNPNITTPAKPAKTGD